MGTSGSWLAVVWERQERGSKGVTQFRSHELAQREFVGKGGSGQRLGVWPVWIKIALCGKKTNFCGKKMNHDCL